jgi:hypothetical protein
MTNESADVGAPPSPFGRYMRSRREQWAFTLLLLLLLLATPTLQLVRPADGMSTRGWDLAAFLFNGVVAVTMVLLIWLVPLTVINERGILRVFGRSRRISWDEVTYFSVENFSRPPRVFVHLGERRRLRLMGVPAEVVPGLLIQIGIESPPT